MQHISGTNLGMMSLAIFQFKNSEKGLEFYLKNYERILFSLFHTTGFYSLACILTIKNTLPDPKKNNEAVTIRNPQITRLSVRKNSSSKLQGEGFEFI